MIELYTSEFFMRKALAEAQTAFENGEVPIGAVVVCENRIISRAHNQVESLKDVTAHAEMIAITAASAYLGAKFLNDCTMFVTVEPCVMCASALGWGRISQIVYGCAEPKSGYSSHGSVDFSAKTKVESGVLEKECKELMQSFFLNKRKIRQLKNRDHLS